MDLLKIAVCDDNNVERDSISQIVDEFILSCSSEQPITYSTFENGADLLATIEGGVCFDLLLLDIVMPLIDGIELAKEIRRKDTLLKILFLSASADFAVDSYGVNAFYYLVKPITKERLLPLLGKVRAEHFDTTEKYIVVKYGATLSRIYLNKMQYAEIIGRTVNFHLHNGEILHSYATMTQVEAKLLIDKRFAKPHRSYVMNMDYILNFAPKGITTVSGAFIPISRILYKQMKQTYIDYLILNSRVL